MPERFSVRERMQSFRHAIAGLWLVLFTQHNAWIHATATIVVVAFGVWQQIALDDWLWVLAAVCSVWGAEAVNTAIERVADVASPDFHPLIKQAKDVAAGAVLIAAAFSILVALLILGPYVLALLK